MQHNRFRSATTVAVATPHDDQVSSTRINSIVFLGTPPINMNRSPIVNGVDDDGDDI